MLKKFITLALCLTVLQSVEAKKPKDCKIALSKAVAQGIIAINADYHSLFADSKAEEASTLNVTEEQVLSAALLELHTKQIKNIRDYVKTVLKDLKDAHLKLTKASSDKDLEKIAKDVNKVLAKFVQRADVKALRAKFVNL